MHKKRIKNKVYFYTSYRDKTRKVKTKYLGHNEAIAREKELEFKGLPHDNPWKLYKVLLFILIGLLLVKGIDETSLKISKTPSTTWAFIFGDDYEVLASPSVANVGIYNFTPNFNMSIFGYGNYSDSDFDDSNGTSSYQWFVNGVVNQTGVAGQLLLCRFDNNYTCEEGETANITQYHVEFNTTAEQINVTLTEENSSLVYVNIPRAAVVTEAFMNVSGYLTSPYDFLQYDSILNGDYLNPGSAPASKHYLAGVIQSGADPGVGIDSWFLITNTTNLSGGVGNILSIKYGNTFGTPSNGNFTYNIKICPVTLQSLNQVTHTNEPDMNCTSPMVLVTDPVNLSSNFSDTSGWQNFTFYDNLSIILDNGTNYILKFEFVEGDLSTSRWWEMYLVDDENNPQNPPTSIAYNYSSTYYNQVGNQQLQFYSKSNYPKGVEVDFGNDGDAEFADANESFDTTNTTADFASEISSYLTSANCVDTYCNVPINVSSNSSGIIGLDALRISYDHYDLDGNFSQGMLANYTYVTKYGSDNNINNHNGTLDMWIKPYWSGADNDGNEYTFFTDSNNVIQLNKSSGNNLVLLVGSSSITCSVSSWVAREWHFVTATWNQGDYIYLYIDGSSCNSGNAPANIPGLGEFILIGSNADNSSQANSTIDELRITGFPRSAEEINAYFSESRSFFQNEIFLNSTDTQLRRDDAIIFELTPKQADGTQGDAANSTTLTISNFIPIMPTLNQPANDTYFSLQYPFNWYNGTDYDSDAVYYVLQIGVDAFTDPVTFVEPVTYYNGSVLESADPTEALIPSSELADSNYSWRVLSSDLTINSSFTDPRVVAIDSTAPNLTLVSPVEKFLNVSSSDTEKEITFYFDVVESNPLENCTFNLNDTAEPVINQTLTHINQTENNFTVTLAFDGYNWSINCTDIANNVNTTEAVLSFVAYENFRDRGRTTNFSALDDPTNVSTLVLEDPEYGVVNFTDVELGLGGGINIDSYVSIALNNITIDGTGVPALNTAANLTLFNLTMTDIYILKDGANCSDACTVIDTTPAAYIFSITGAGSYTTAGIPIPPVYITPTGGSGGGGGTKTLTKSSSFSSEPEQFVLQMKKGAVFFEKMSIANTGDLALVFDLSHNLGEHASFLENHFRLEPGEDKRFSVSFSAGDPGVHAGKIVVTAGTLQKVIPVTLEVSSERIIVDAKLEVLSEYAELKSGDPLKAQVTLFNTAQKSVPVVVTYVIKDLDGNVVAEETETFDMFDKKSFIKDFDTSNLKAGQYVTGMNVRYLDSFVTSSARFEIKGEPVKKPFIELKLKWQYVVVIVSLFILVALLKLRSADFRRAIGRKKRELKKYGK